MKVHKVIYVIPQSNIYTILNNNNLQDIYLYSYMYVTLNVQINSCNFNFNGEHFSTYKVTQVFDS